MNGFVYKGTVIEPLEIKTHGHVTVANDHPTVIQNAALKNGLTQFFSIVKLNTKIVDF